MLKNGVNESVFVPKSTRLTVQKMKFSLKDFFRKYDQIPRKRRFWPHLLKRSLMKNFIFCTMSDVFSTSDF